MLSFEAFTTVLCDQLDVDADVPRDRDAGVFEHWALDSLQAFQLIVTVEAMASAVVPPPTIPEIFTAGDAYAYYCALLHNDDAVQ